MMNSFLELVAKERARQINDEGYKREHDDEHTDGSLADAAACYAVSSSLYIFKVRDDNPHNMRIKLLDPVWPWNESYFKKDKHPRKKQLIISAALLMAEYDRLEREEKKDTRCKGCNYLLEKDGHTWCGLMGISMDAYSARCDEYQLPPFATSEDNPILKSFMRSSSE
jgi:hypothetical protein